MAAILLHHRKPLSLSDVCAVAKGARVTIDRATLRLLDRRRAAIVRAVRLNPVAAYGFNRGFGSNVDQKVSPELVDALQQNLIRSHACGVGNPAPREVVRAMMLLRAKSLALGHSGVRAEVVQQIVRFLNADITPSVPLFGSVGASGDLAPLAHVALALMGEGEVFIGRSLRALPTKKALRKKRLAPLALQMKEGLALINGVQYSTALGILSCERLQALLDTAIVNTALATQVLLGSDAPFGEDLITLRPHPGAVKVSAKLRRLIRGSPLREAHRDFDIDGEVQDPYNLRCAPQILGACAELIDDAAQTFVCEANSVTDNPLLLTDPKAAGRLTRIVSGGHFHGMPIAVKLYSLLQAVGIVAQLSNVRCVRYVDRARNKGLGGVLLWNGLSSAERSISSGMMIPEYVSASLTNVVLGECMPSHLFSLSTAAGQEDHVSMSAGLAVRVYDSLPRLAEILGIELAYAAQAAALRKALPSFPSKLSLSEAATRATHREQQALRAALRKALKGSRLDASIETSLQVRMPASSRPLSPICESIVRDVNRLFPPVKSDRVLAQQLQTLAKAVLEGRFVR